MVVAFASLFQEDETPSVLVLQVTISQDMPRYSDEVERGPRTTSDPSWKAERHTLAMLAHAARTPGDLAAGC